MPREFKNASANALTLAEAFAKGGDRSAVLEVSTFRLHHPSYLTRWNFSMVKCHPNSVIMFIMKNDDN